jgi:hypothetical protein
MTSITKKKREEKARTRAYGAAKRKKREIQKETKEKSGSYSRVPPDQESKLGLHTVTLTLLTSQIRCLQELLEELTVH